MNDAHPEERGIKGLVFTPLQPRAVVQMLAVVVLHPLDLLLCFLVELIKPVAIPLPALLLARLGARVGEPDQGAMQAVHSYDHEHDG